MQKRFNLLAFPANMMDATSFYRAIGPLGHLRRACPWLNIQIVEAVTWPILEMCDGIFLQRPFATNMLQLCGRARAQGKPIWVDHDDDVFHVPDDNPCFEVYAAEGTKRNVAKIIASADFVSVSTDTLKDLYGPLARTIETIPNALMHTIVGDPVEQRDQQKLVLWRGSDTHKRDLMQHAVGIVQAMRKHQDHRIQFSGYRPFFMLEQLGDQAIVNPPLDVVDYFALLRTLRPSVVVVPLADHDFNRAKSNIAWIEATYCGAIVVAPDLPEWRRPGVTLYRGTADIERALDEALNLSVPEAYRLWRASSEFIRRELRVEHVNDRRIDILKRMQNFNGDARAVTERIRSPAVMA